MDFLFLDHLQKVLDNSDLNLATEMHLLLNSTTIVKGTVGNFRNLIMGESLRAYYFILKISIILLSNILNNII